MKRTGLQRNEPPHMDAEFSTISATPDSPSPRVGTAFTALAGKIYMFSGRGGASMTPIDEQGAIWEFNIELGKWSLISPLPPNSYPSARSYHTFANDGIDNIFLHAGCPEKGRLSDLWSFSISGRQWRQLSSAPDPPRGGTSITFAHGKIYRLHGFDGQREQGGSLDVYTLETDSWDTLIYPADGVSGPVPRSVSFLVSGIFGGRMKLVTGFGEVNPSALGHQGAGRMAGDVWVWDVVEGGWKKVEVEQEGGDRPVPRGWLAADVMMEGGNTHVVVHGGLGEDNARLGDVWVLRF